MANKKVAPEAFDETKLAELEEPITVTVHQTINGRPMPMSLPTKPGEDASGTGWTREEVRQLDEFLVPFFGGGDFRCAATGSNGSQMRWQSYFPIDRYPAKSMAAAPVAQQVQPSNGQLGGGSVMVVPPTPSYAPPPAWMQGATPIAQPQQPTGYPQFAQGYPQQQQQQGGYSQFPHHDDRVQQEREARLALEADIRRERLENTYTTQLTTLGQEIRTLKESMNVRPAGESPELLALRAEIASLQKSHEDDKITQMLREVQTSTQAQITALTQMMQQQQAAVAQAAAIAAAAPKGPDPMLMMMLESTKAQAAAQLEIAKLQADTQKETARLQAEAAREAARTAIGPREMIDLVAKMSGGQDQLTAGYTRLLESQAHVFENMLNAQGPQTHPALEMVSQGMQGIMGTAQRYIEMKEKASLGQSQAIAISAQAQAAIAAQRGLAGAPVPEMAPDGRAPIQTAPPAAAVEVEEEGDEEEDDDSPEAMEAMEQALFGPALDAVRRLRAGVKSKILSPEQAAAALIKGIDHYAKQGQSVQAFALWQQGELAKLVQILIPDELPSYKEQLTGILFEARKSV